MSLEKLDNGDFIYPQLFDKFNNLVDEVSGLTINSGATISGDYLPLSSFTLYSANTLNLINEVSGTTQNQLNTKLNNSDFNGYSSNTQTNINNKLNITTFNSYTANTSSNSGNTNFNPSSSTIGNSLTLLNQSINTGDTINTFAGKTQGQLNNKADKSEMLTKDSLLSVDVNGRIINTGYSIDNLLKDVSNSIYIDAIGNIISSSNGGFSSVNIRGTSNAYLTALSWDGTALRLGGGFSFVRSAGLIPVTNGAGQLGNQTLFFSGVFANNHIGANYGAPTTINIGRQESGGVLQSTISAASTTVAVNISSTPNTGVGGTGDVSLTTGLASGGGASGNVSLVTLNTSWQSGQKIIFVGNRVASPIGNPTGGYFEYGDGGNPVFRTSDGAIITLTRTTGWGLPTGTLTRTTFDTSTVTTAQLAERVGALISDLRQTNGLLSA